MITPGAGLSSTARPLRVAVVQIAVLAALLGLVELVLFVGTPEGPYWIVATITVTGWIYFAAGAYAWVRRPGNRMGPLLCAGGIVWLVAALVNTTYPPLVAAGMITATLGIAVVLHILLAFPSGRLRTRAARALTVLGYVTTIVGNSPVYLLDDQTVAGTNPLQIGDDPTLYELGRTLNGVALAVAVLGTSALLVRRLRRSRPEARRILTPLYLYGIAAAVVVSFAGQLARFADLGVYEIFLVQITLLAGVPLAFAAGVLRGGFARTGEIEELGAWLGAGERARGDLGPALARTVGDPSLTLVFRTDDGWVDGDGRPAPPTEDRALQVVRVGDRAVGAIVYDPTLVGEPEVVRDAGNVVALAVDRERLTAALLAGQEQLRISRARLVENGDRERRRLAQDLHDRLQGRLVLLALRFGQLPGGGDVAALRADLDEVLTELRRVVQGVMPSLLVERGLVAAVEDMAERAPLPTVVDVGVDEDGRRLPEAVEGTAFHVVAEALTNAVKHADASALRIGLHRADGVLHLVVCDDGVGGAVAAGVGLRGIADRVHALGGSLTIASRAGEGTRIEVSIPCGS
ncbi:sensor histidine kinase [Actinomycetospora chlora]|uniref:histidine kinase n=1 Tax=Actinomycetospora chlora TaxID=663608 RepID=A0ABP9A335_9PSEU